MRCAACGFENRDAVRFCGGCGAAQTVECTECGAPMAPELRFCTSCGARRTTEAPAGEASGGFGGRNETTRAERRRVSVLFVDLVDFTTLAESLDPEEVRAVQSRYFEVARSIVSAYGGTIEKFIGDAVMAVWGAPIAHEDDAMRAVRAALAMVDGVGRLGAAGSAGPLAPRAAVTTGEAAVTVGAIGQGMVAGDLVNTAARLQAEATPGAVLVDGPTMSLAPDAAEFEAVGPITLKGRSAPLAAHRAVARAGGVPGRGDGSHTGPFTGRERELRELLALFDGVARDRRSRLVSVTGIAGIGKSRLAWEFGQRLESRPELVAWHAGRAPAYGDMVTFTAVAEMVRRRLHIAEGAETEVARRQLASALPEWVRTDEERQWMEPRLAALIGGGDGSGFDREELFASWRRFFERVSDSMPALLVFEDLQWADAGLLDFVEHLAAWARDHPIMIVALARPELMDRRPSWGSGGGSFTATHLERLDDDAMRTLLTGRLPDLDDRLLAEIVRHAGGVPLYAVEMARILADRRDTEDGPTSDAPVTVPESLHGLIAARIDALPEAERRLLLAAAVLGRRFAPAALAGLAPPDPPAIRERIEGLVRRELLAVDDDPGSAGHGELSFLQDLVRDVAYRTLSRGERRELHLAAARYLESRPEGELAESLAGHLAEAHRLAPEHADARRIARRAVAALRRAAHVALDLHAPERALEQLEEALELADGPHTRVVVLGEAASAARAAARLETAAIHLRELVSLRRDAGQTEEAARARAQLASVLLLAQHNDAALSELEAALRSGRGMTRDAAGVELASQLARARMLVGDDRGALSWVESALTGAEKLRLDGVVAELLITRGTARFHLGDESGGLADLNQAIADAEAKGTLNTELRARNNVAWLAMADDPQFAMAMARRAVELANDMGVGDMAVQLGAVACTIAVDTGDWDWALTLAAELEQRGMSDAHRIDVAAAVSIIGALRGAPEPTAALDAVVARDGAIDTQLLAAAEHARAWASFVAGDHERTHALARAAATASLGVERVHHLALATRAALWMGSADVAAASLATLEGLGAHGRATEAAIATLRAGLAAVRGEPDASRRYEAAVEAWRPLKLPLNLALSILDAERMLGAPNSGDGEAMTILRALGASGLTDLIRRETVRSSAGRRPPDRSPGATGRTAAPTGGGRRPRSARAHGEPPG